MNTEAKLLHIDDSRSTICKPRAPNYHKLADVAYFISQNAQALDASSKAGNSLLVREAIDGIEKMIAHARDSEWI